MFGAAPLLFGVTRCRGLRKEAQCEIAANHLQQHSRHSDAEVLKCHSEVADNRPFSEGAKELVGKHHSEEMKNRDFKAALCHHSCDERKKHRFDKYRRKHGRQRHPEEQRIHHRRGDGGEKPHSPPVFIRPDEGEEIDGEPD